MANLLKRLRGILKTNQPDAARSGQLSFSQCGEDLIFDFAFMLMGIERPAYLDIGANDPIAFSNTYRMYTRGCHGVCVEPDPSLVKRFREVRPRDTCVEVGVGGEEESTAKFYMMDPSTLSTFSESEARRLQSLPGHRLVKTIHVPIHPVQRIVTDYFEKGPDLLSLDIEGLDLTVLQAWDFTRHRPAVCCVETLTYSPNGQGEKIQPTIDHMLNNDYMLYADTFVNSIFVDQKQWKSRSA